MRLLSLFLILLLYFISIHSFASDWEEAIPPNFTQLERFFLNCDRHVTLGVSYI